MCHVLALVLCVVFVMGLETHVGLWVWVWVRLEVPTSNPHPHGGFLWVFAISSAKHHLAENAFKRALGDLFVLKMFLREINQPDDTLLMLVIFLFPPLTHPSNCLNTHLTPSN